MNNWDLYKRMLCNIQKAYFNGTVNVLMVKHYQLLHTALVITDNDEDIFNDTFIKITYMYLPDLDFCILFTFLFNQLKGAYCRDSRSKQMYPVIEDRLNILGSDPEESKDEDTSIVDRIKALCQTKIQKYAIFKESTKKASKEDKQRRLVEDVQK